MIPINLFRSMVTFHHHHSVYRCPLVPGSVKPMTRGVKIFNKQNYLEDGVCEKHFIYSFAHGVSIFWGVRYLSLRDFQSVQ